MRLTQPSSWKLPKQSSSIAPPDVWTNVDMDPVPPERRTWGRGAFVTYWVSDLITISTWSSGSAIITLGECVPFSFSQIPANDALRPHCYRCRPHHFSCRYLQCHPNRAQRLHRCQFTHPVSDCFSSQSWILVQLLRCREPRHSSHVLVWCAYRLWRYLRLSREYCMTLKQKALTYVWNVDAHCDLA